MDLKVMPKSHKAYIISPLTSQLRTNSRNVTIKYVGPIVIYKIVDPHSYLLMTLDGKILRGLFGYESIYYFSFNKLKQIQWS